MLKQRTPMARGKGFQRKQVAAPPPAGNEAACGLQGDSTAFDRHQQAALKPLRRGTYAAPPAAAAIPKAPRAENAHLLAMARDKPCLIHSPLCNFDSETTVACHGAGVANGKGMAYKVPDWLSCWGCSGCNHYTDAYNGATKQQKADVFTRGFLSQVCEWRAIASSTAADPKDRAAAQWALDHLNATPVGQEESTL